jgi:F0F1-type ATP synthase delta subunit
MLIRLTHQYAKALLEYAEERDLGEIYRQALTIMLSGSCDPEHAPEGIGGFIRRIPGGEEEVLSVLYAFLELARGRMNLLAVEVISAVHLTLIQQAAVERKLTLMFRKQLELTFTVDPSILGGLRVIAADTVFDDSIKRKLMDMKNSVYEGVFSIR